VEQMADALEGMALSALPEVPEPGKWTKLGPALEFLVLGSCCCAYLSKNFGKAFEHIVFSDKAQKAQQAADDDTANADPKLLQQLEWHKVMGAKFQQSSRRFVLVSLCHS
jgi:hypothetical protein